MIDKTSKLIGKKVEVKDRESIYFRDWGIVKFFDGDFYGVAIANGCDSIPVFERSQIKLIKEKNRFD